MITKKKAAMKAVPVPPVSVASNMRQQQKFGKMFVSAHAAYLSIKKNGEFKRSENSIIVVAALESMILVDVDVVLACASAQTIRLRMKSFT